MENGKSKSFFVNLTKILNGCMLLKSTVGIKNAKKKTD